MHLPQKQIQLPEELLSKVDSTEHFVGEQAGELHRTPQVDSSSHVVTSNPSSPIGSLSPVSSGSLAPVTFSVLPNFSANMRVS